MVVLRIVQSNITVYWHVSSRLFYWEIWTFVMVYIDVSPWFWMRLCRRYYVRNPSITYSSFSMLDILWLFQNNYWSLYSIFGTVICYLQFFIILHCLINLINCIYLNYAQHDNFTSMINEFLGQLFSLIFKQRSIGKYHNSIGACQC